MLFFKSFKPTSDENVPSQNYRTDKLRYVRDKNGTGRWVRPTPQFSTDYCEDVIY